MMRHATRVAIALILGTGAVAVWLYMQGQSAAQGQPPQPRALDTRAAEGKIESTPASAKTVALQNCAPVTRVGSISDLVALGPREWTVDSPVPVTTADATATVTLTVKDGGRLGRVSIRAAVPGLRETRQGEVVIEPGATFRMRFERPPRFLPPDSPNLRVTFEAPCSAPCKAGERRCGLNGICYADGVTFCRECDQGPPERCACAALDGSDKPNGTSCVFAHGDIGVTGQCMAGQCGYRPDK